MFIRRVEPKNNPSVSVDLVSVGYFVPIFLSLSECAVLLSALEEEKVMKYR